tara:strand:- start:861 stop:1166 length:306 start_codon:yes stop_codon:yes gene_type:complete
MKVTAAATMSTLSSSTPKFSHEPVSKNKTLTFLLTSSVFMLATRGIRLHVDSLSTKVTIKTIHRFDVLVTAKKRLVISSVEAPRGKARLEVTGLSVSSGVI